MTSGEKTSQTKVIKNTLKKYISFMVSCCINNPGFPSQIKYKLTKPPNDFNPSFINKGKEFENLVYNIAKT